MITKIRFKNFKVLRDAELPLGKFTLIVGPNGTGKSTGFQPLQVVSKPTAYPREMIESVGAEDDVEVIVSGNDRVNIGARWNKWGRSHDVWQYHDQPDVPMPQNPIYDLERRIKACRVFSFDPGAIAAPVTLAPAIELTAQGGNLAGVLDGLRDKNPERFEALNRELNRWLPEFDRVLFDTPSTGKRAICLRTSSGEHKIKASDLS